MSRLQAGYYLSMLFLLTMGLATGRWEFYAVLFMLVLLLAAALLLNLWVFLSFTCEQKLSHARAIKGDLPELSISIFNNKPFSFVNMCVTVRTPTPSQKAKICFDIPPGSTYQYVLPLTCDFRGVYSVGITTLEVGDFFGLLRMRFDLRSLPSYKMEKIIVYPKLIHLSAPPGALHRGAGQGGLSNKLLTLDGGNFYDTRKYNFGDSFKHIHRTISARKREVFVKSYDAPAEASVIIAIDACAAGLETECLLQYANIVSECACAVAHYFLQTGFGVTLIGSDPDQPPIKCMDMSDFSALYDYLAIAEFDLKGDIVSSLESFAKTNKSAGALYAISARCDDALAGILSDFTVSGRFAAHMVPVMRSGEENTRAPDKTPGVAVAYVTGAHDL